MLNKVTKSIVEKLTKQFNKPNELIGSLATNITPARYPIYHESSFKERMQSHEELNYIENSVRGFKLIYSRRALDDVKLLQRIEVNDSRALLCYLREPVICECVVTSLKKMREASIRLPDWLSNIYLEIEHAWFQNKRFANCTAGDADRLLQSLRVVEWLTKKESTALEIDVRTLSTQLFNDSKLLEGLTSVLVKLLEPASPKELLCESPEKILAYWGISKFPPSFKIKGCLKIKTALGEVDISAAWPYVEFPPDGIIGFNIGIHPPYILFIENKTTYQRYTREINDGGWVLFTNGFPSRHWQALFKEISHFIPIDIPIYHWGDIDVGGYRILVFLARLLKRDIRPFMMDIFHDTPDGVPISLQKMSEITVGFGGTCIGELHNKVFVALLCGMDAKRVEQESILIKSVLNSEKDN
jgi:hypothetical protein